MENFAMPGEYHQKARGGIDKKRYGPSCHVFLAGWTISFFKNKCA
jgi:hypothetical protein